MSRIRRREPLLKYLGFHHLGLQVQQTFLRAVSQLPRVTPERIRRSISSDSFGVSVITPPPDKRRRLSGGTIAPCIIVELG